jgi:HAD superfamily hydrolase (TIGR01509 family)
MQNDLSNTEIKVFLFDIFGVLCGLEDGKVNTKIFSIIEKLRKNYKTAILSNADAISVRARFEKQNFPLERYFDYVLISSETGLLKPDPEAFKHCLSEMNVKPEEVVFVDDTRKNILLAESVGMKGHHFRDVKEFESWAVNFVIPAKVEIGMGPDFKSF